MLYERLRVFEMAGFMRRCGFVVLLLGSVALLLFSAQGIAEPETVWEKVEQQQDVLNAYEEFLLEKKFLTGQELLTEQEFLTEQELLTRQASTGNREDLFALLYLDRDDIPELAVIRDARYESSPAALEIYTYDSGRVSLVGTYERENSMNYYFDKGGVLIHICYDRGTAYYVHQVKDGQDVLAATFEEKSSAQGTVYSIDGEEVSEEQFAERLWSQADGPVKFLGADRCRSTWDSQIAEKLREELQTLILTQYDTLRSNLLAEAGVEEDDILWMDYDDYDGDGAYEAFAFLGERCDDRGETLYKGSFWFAGANRCVRLPEQFGDVPYRKIDGLMAHCSQRHEQKYLYYEPYLGADVHVTGIWTLYGEPVAVRLPQNGQIVHRPDCYGFELWVDGDDHYYDPDGGRLTGHTRKPYFYRYSGEYDLWPDEGEALSREELAELCGFDLAAQVEAEGYGVTDIIRWTPHGIVTVNYTVPCEGDGTFSCENIIWDCYGRDYWRSEERGVTSWRDAGVGGSFQISAQE